jgi:hypothetical protein
MTSSVGRCGTAPPDPIQHGGIPWHNALIGSGDLDLTARAKAVSAWD